jgi:hypothetical protein
VKKAENISWAGVLNIIYFSWSGWGVFKTSHLHENENLGRLLHAAAVFLHISIHLVNFSKKKNRLVAFGPDQPTLPNTSRRP